MVNTCIDMDSFEPILPRMSRIEDYYVAVSRSSWGWSASSAEGVTADISKWMNWTKWCHCFLFLFAIFGIINSASLNMVLHCSSTYTWKNWYTEVKMCWEGRTYGNSFHYLPKSLIFPLAVSNTLMMFDVWCLMLVFDSDKSTAYTKILQQAAEPHNQQDLECAHSLSSVLLESLGQKDHNDCETH